MDLLTHVQWWLIPNGKNHKLRLPGDSFSVYYTCDGNKVEAAPHLDLKGDKTYYGKLNYYFKNDGTINLFWIEKIILKDADSFSNL